MMKLSSLFTLYEFVTCFHWYTGSMIRYIFSLFYFSLCTICLLFYCILLIYMYIVFFHDSLCIWMPVRIYAIWSAICCTFLYKFGSTKCYSINMKSSCHIVVTPHTVINIPVIKKWKNQHRVHIIKVGVLLYNISVWRPFLVYIWNNFVYYHLKGRVTFSIFFQKIVFRQKLVALSQRTLWNGLRNFNVSFNFWRLLHCW